MLPAMPGAPTRVWVRAGVLLAVPVAVAVVTLAAQHWYPVLDLAQTELRLRDVPTRHAPLIGLPGRIGRFLQGSHPGPLSFYALWPVYRLSGGSAWSMQLAAAVCNVGAVLAAVWLVARRGGPAVVWSFAVALALVMRFYGASLLTQPWNPYLPILWFVVFVVAIWGLRCGDRLGAPVAVATGSLCVQTHISYAALVAGLGLLGAAALAVEAVRGDPARRRGAVRTLGGSALLGLVLWFPPLWQQAISDHGNLGIVWRYFTDPPESGIGLRAGIEQILVHLNPWSLLARRNVTSGSVLPGVAVLTAWFGSVGIALQARERRLLELHLVLGTALVLGAVSISRIFGYVWFYLMLWAWALGALVLWATAWGGWLAWTRWVEASRHETTARRAPTAAAAVAALVVVGVFAWEARRVEVPEPPLSDLMAALVPDLRRALESGTVPGGGRDGRYLVTYVDTVNIGAAEYGLVNELERAGFRAGGPPVLRWVVTPHRVLTPRTATATVHFSRGLDIPRARRTPGFTLVASYDPRTPVERRRYRALRREAIDRLDAAGRADLVPLVDENLFIATFDPRLDATTKRLLEELLDLGQPAAVFVGPPTLRLMTR